MNTDLPAKPKIHTRLHDTPISIEKNNFRFKSLSDWSLNFHIGCLHGCRFCYCPSINRQQSNRLRSHGIDDPVADWGRYLLLRPLNECRFRASLKKAELTPRGKLSHDGNRAVMLCSMTDAYQVIKASTPSDQKMMQKLARSTRRKSLELIRDESTLNVRILTRSPLAREDFDLMKSFGNRLLLGTSLPTLDPHLSKVYEPNAPAPSHRLKLLQEAHAVGINVFAAVAPVFPGTTHKELVELFTELRSVNPVTIFMEPINLRLDIARKIQERAKLLGATIDMSPFENKASWAPYAIESLHMAESAAKEAGVLDVLHLWPDKQLGTSKIVSAQNNPDEFQHWLNQNWSKVSDWP